MLELEIPHKRHNILLQMRDMIHLINESHLKDLGFKPLIWKNKRGTKDKQKLKKFLFNKSDRKEYLKRHIVENSFSWMKTKVPRLEKIYDKNISNYYNMVLMAVCSGMLKRTSDNGQLVV